MAASSKEGKKWLLRTGRPLAAYEDPNLNPHVVEINEIFEKEGTYGLNERFPHLAKKLGDLTPAKVIGMHMKYPVRYVADEDGEFEIDEEEAAIWLYKCYKAVNPATHFDEKHGLPKPKSLVVEEEKTKKERNAIQRLIMSGRTSGRTR